MNMMLYSLQTGKSKLRPWLLRAVLLLSIFSWEGNICGPASQRQTKEQTEYVAKPRPVYCSKFSPTSTNVESLAILNNCLPPVPNVFEGLFYSLFVKLKLANARQVVAGISLPNRLFPPANSNLGDGLSA